MKYIRISLLVAFLTFSSIFAAQSSQDTEIFYEFELLILGNQSYVTIRYTSSDSLYRYWFYLCDGQRQIWSFTKAFAPQEPSQVFELTVLIPTFHIEDATNVCGILFDTFTESIELEFAPLTILKPVAYLPLIFGE